MAGATVELYDGLETASQNRWPSLRFDLLSLTAPLSPFMGAGFYYKTFMWPAAFWEKLYEPLIRRAAGLGCAAGLPDPDHYEKAFLYCDVLVIGAGPAGLAAALAAGRSGARVVLCDESFEFGGRLLSERREIDVPVRYVGFDIPNEFVVGYGLDYAERYRDLPFIGTLNPSVYS